MKDLAAILDAERERQGVTIMDLAQRAAVPLGSVHGILKGNTPNPGILTVRLLLAALGRTLTWLDRRLSAEPAKEQ